MTAAGCTPARQHLLTAELAGAPVERVEMHLVELAPGQSAGRHLHPCPVVGIVLSGAIRFQVAGMPNAIIKQGEAFHEPSGAEISHFENSSETKRATFLACYLLGPDERQLIEMLE